MAEAKPLVYVAIFEHKHGTDVRVFQSEDDAQRWRVDLAKEYWDTEMQGPMPRDATDAEIADDYFDRMGDYGEFFNIQESELE
jgi:hypothetical protein